MHYFTLIKNYTFVPFVPVWSTPIIYNLIWSATLKVFIQELGLLKYNCFKLFLFLKLNIYFYIPFHIFFFSSCAFTGIVVNEYHKTSWSSTWEFSHVGGECKKFVLFQWSVSILFVESCGELDIILTRIIPAKMIDNTQTSNKKTLNESSVYVYSNILPHFILNILVTWRHQYLNGSTNKSSL